jgi:hypothetical protein
MKVVALCNKLSRSKSSQLRGDEAGAEASAEENPPVVSNKTTGKTMEVTFELLSLLLEF